MYLLMPHVNWPLVLREQVRVHFTSHGRIVPHSNACIIERRYIIHITAINY